MTELTHQAFMEAVRKKVLSYTEKELQELLITWAAELPSSERCDFLMKLRLPKKKRREKEDDQALLKEVEVFAQRVEDGYYCDGWGWDDAYGEERDWGDEGWANEMDGFFVRARKLVLQEAFEAAEAIYRLLFDALEKGQEPGHLPGDPDSCSMLTVDLSEQGALALRSAYANTPEEKRPNRIYELMETYRYDMGEISLKQMAEAAEEPLPGFDAFLAKWIELLKQRASAHDGKRLREAIQLQGGVDALAVFARDNARQYPEAFLDWLQELESKNELESMISAAKEGLAAIPADYQVRAAVGEILAGLAERRQDGPLAGEGHRAAFFSQPSLEHALKLYTWAKANQCYEPIRKEAEQRMEQLWSQGKKHADYQANQPRTAFVSEGTLAGVWLLGGCHQQVFGLCEEESTGGWISWDSPTPLFIGFLLRYFSFQKPYGQMCQIQWEQAVEKACGGVSCRKLFYDEMEETLQALQLTREEENLYMNWCVKKISTRIREIIDGKHRSSYDQAARLLVALAEVKASREEKQQGLALIERYQSQYSRYTVFRRELSQAMQQSGLKKSR